MDRRNKREKGRRACRSCQQHMSLRNLRTRRRHATIEPNCCARQIPTGFLGNRTDRRQCGRDFRPEIAGSITVLVVVVGKSSGAKSNCATRCPVFHMRTPLNRPVLRTLSEIRQFVGPVRSRDDSRAEPHGHISSHRRAERHRQPDSELAVSRANSSFSFRRGTALEPIENPLGPKVLPMSSEYTATHVTGIDPL